MSFWEKIGFGQNRQEEEAATLPTAEEMEKYQIDQGIEGKASFEIDADPKTIDEALAMGETSESIDLDAAPLPASEQGPFAGANLSHEDRRVVDQDEKRAA